MKWTIIRDPQYSPDKLRYFVKGKYQRHLLEGYENLSGSSLRGKARSNWSMAYQRSRRNLLERLEKAGVPVSEARGEHGARILVIG